MKNVNRERGVSVVFMVSNYLAVEENAINIYYQVCIVDVTLVVIDALDL